ncbi:LAMI_0C04588g1_1 [Lachancea mirantina]|uniref:LAMI_0C04588g1_1 n=1 Tax=Lachancea mirantina TaxID=1230905 RepID=A0A1G4J2B6_9SACH|nr:LAMI_0C04588g1_1 [Lachancea mirantina]
MLSQGSIPEVKEDSVGHALEERKSKLMQFQDLGPPDLITMTKYIPSASTSGSQSNNKRTLTPEPSLGIKTQDLHTHDKLKGEIGTFLYCAGADTSDPTSIAVYLKTLADVISEEPQIWFGKHRQYKVARITYSAWNAFRKCDVRVVVHIPGAVQSYLLDASGEILQIGEDDGNMLWAETFASGIVRSITMVTDNKEEGEVNSVVETRILNPLMSGEIGDVAETFIKLFPLVYAKGPTLGGPCDVSVVSKTNNYLCETLVNVTRLAQNFDLAHSVLADMLPLHPEIVVLLARILFEGDREIEAIKAIHDDLEAQGTSIADYRSELLCVQAKFLLTRKRDCKAARSVAETAVNCSPSEFRPWHLLVSSYIGLNDVENALLTLNASPMTPLKEKFVFKRVVPVAQDSPNLHLPLPVDVILDEVTGLSSQDVINEHRAVDASLINLPAANLKSTFQIAYKFLTEIVQKTGWEALLKYRSKLFVMEEEYQVASTPPSESDGSKNPADGFRSKRLCERWLDNLFMLLYEDLKTYTLWQAEQLHFEAQNTRYTKSTLEWELLGLCAYRLGHYREAAVAFDRGLAQRFSAQSSRKLLHIYLLQRETVKNSTELSSSQLLTALRDLDNSIIDLCVRLCCWNHRWYCEFSVILLDAMSVVVQDLGLTKLSNEIASRFPQSVVDLAQRNLLDFFANYTHGDYDK